MAGRIRIGEILVRAGVIDQHQLNAALGEQRRWGRPLGATLVKMGFLEERDLVRALASQLALPVASLEGKRIAPAVLDLVPARMAQEHMVLPLFVKKDDRRTTVFLAMEDPGDLAVLDDLAFRTGMQVKPVMMAPSELAEGVDRYYRDRMEAHTASEVAAETVSGTVTPGTSSASADASPQALESATPSPARAIEPEPTTGGTEELVRHFKLGTGTGTGTAGAGDATGATPAKASAASASNGSTATMPEDTLLEEAHLASPPPRKAPTEGEEALAHPPIESLASYDAKTRTILHVLTQLLIEKGVISREEFHDRVSALAAIDRQRP